MWHNPSSKISAGSATPLASAGNFAAAAAAQAHRLKAVVPLINLKELAVSKRLFEFGSPTTFNCCVIQQPPVAPEAHRTAAPPEGSWLLCSACRHHPQRFPTASLAPQKSWSLSPGMQRIILTSQLTELHRSLRKVSQLCHCCAV